MPSNTEQGPEPPPAVVSQLNMGSLRHHLSPMQSCTACTFFQSPVGPKVLPMFSKMLSFDPVMDSKTQE